MGFLWMSALAGFLLLPLLAELPSFFSLVIFCAINALAWLICRAWIFYAQKKSAANNTAYVFEKTRMAAHFFLCAMIFSLCFFWAVHAARQVLAARIPAAQEGELLQVQGRVSGVSDVVPHGLRFRFVPQPVQANHRESNHALARATGRWQLFLASPRDNPAAQAWMQHPDALPPEQAAAYPWPSAHCTLTVKLKRPHGVTNAGGFDYEAWLLSEGITATGSVKSINCTRSPRFSVDALRLQLRLYFQNNFAQEPSAGVLLALITGDRALMPEALWERYSATGVVHLMAISGLHITLLAVLMAFAVRRILQCFPRVGLRIALHKPALLAGFLVAAAYSVVAGFSVPTERTLIMLGVVVALQWREQRWPPLHILAAAMLTVLVWSPLAVHAVGFWLSFGAVALLLFMGHAVAHLPAWRQAVQVQMGLSFLLLPLTLWFFERASWVSPMANLIAVPVVTFAIVPLGLLGFLCWLLGSAAPWLAVAALWCWRTALALLDVLNALLEQFAAWPYASVSVSLSGWWPLGCLLLALLCLCQPLLPRLRWLALVFIGALWLPPNPVPAQALRVTVMDVGQGLAVLIQTHKHRLLYDTGPRFGSADAGQRVVVPVLHQAGVYQLDALMLSHDDSDHTGGASSVLAAVPIKAGLGAHPATVIYPAATPWQPCRGGQQWVWDGWQFEVLYPTQAEFEAAAKTNNKSCVLRISRGQNSLLLMGDLEAVGERSLLERMAAGTQPPNQTEPRAPSLASTVLVLGHHGSRTSSTLEFLQAVQPQLALVSAGYRNPFRHPNKVVVERLNAAQIPWLNTASSGAITVQMGSAGEWQVSEMRTAERRYWR